MSQFLEKDLVKPVIKTSSERTWNGLKNYSRASILNSIRNDQYPIRKWVLSEIEAFSDRPDTEFIGLNRYNKPVFKDTNDFIARKYSLNYSTDLGVTLDWSTGNNVTVIKGTENVYRYLDKLIKEYNICYNLESSDEEYILNLDNTLAGLKLQKAKLYTKAMKLLPSSPQQKVINKQITDIEEKIKMHYFQDGFNEESQPVRSTRTRSPRQAREPIQSHREEPVLAHENYNQHYDPIDSYHDREEFAFGEPKSVFTPKTSFSIKELSEDEIKDLVNELAPSDLVYCLSYASLLKFTDELKALTSEVIKKKQLLQKRMGNRRR